VFKGLRPQTSQQNTLNIIILWC